jgi:hypothetical protein
MTGRAWDKAKYVHQDGFATLEDSEEAVADMQRVLEEEATQCEDCGYYFLTDEMSLNDYYVICSNCEERRGLHHELEPLTWDELRAWAYGIVQDLND